MIKKIPITPPLYHNEKFGTDFNQRAELFNFFFAEQCSIIQNRSELPTDQFLASITFSQNNI